MNKVEITETNDLIDAVIERFLQEEPIDEILKKLKLVSQSEIDHTKFSSWANYNDFFGGSHFMFIIPEEEIFMLGEDIFDYYEQVELDLDKDDDILKFMNKRIEEQCEGNPQSFHYENYKGVFIAATCTIYGQLGPCWSNFGIYKSIENALESCNSFIKVHETNENYNTSDAQLISMFRRNITDKYFK